VSDLDDLIVTVVVGLTDYFSGDGVRAATVRRVWEDTLEPMEGPHAYLRLEVVREDVVPAWRHTLPGAIPLTVPNLEAFLDDTRLIEAWEWDVLQAFWAQDWRQKRDAPGSGGRTDETGTGG